MPLPQPGDHLVSTRTGYLHHGLYVGHHEVIHYTGYSSGEDSGQVVLTSLDAFGSEHGWRIVNHAFRRYAPEPSIERALSRLGEAQYNALLNNCEHFVTWCIQGFPYSTQVQSLIDAGIAIGSQVIPRLPVITMETMAVTQPLRETVIASAVTTALPSASQTAAIVAGGLTLTSVAPVAVPMAIAGAALYGAKKLFDWLTD